MSSIRNRNKKVAVLAALGVFAFSGGMAIAYYNAQIDVAGANGTATVSAAQATNIVATFAAGQTPTLVPGAAAQPLVLTLTNNNSYSVGVDNKTLSLGVNTVTSDKPGCTSAEAALSAAPVLLPSQVIPANGSITVPFQIQMRDEPLDQTPCVGATFTFPVLVS